MATDLPSDEDLILKVQKGNNSAFGQLVKRHSTRYYNLAYRYLINREEAEDIVQTAFLKLWEKPHQWSPKKGAQFTTWFYRIIVNLCLDRIKKHKNLSIPENFDIKDDSNNQEDDLVIQQQKKALALQIGKLPKRQKTAMILCFYEDMSHAQAAQVMKVNIKALQSLLMRAKTTLKLEMKERG